MRSMHTARNRSHRLAFTLVELIVVVTIIAILVSLSAAAVIRFIIAQEISNTRTTINKLYAQLDTAYKANRNKYFREQPIPQAYHDWIRDNLANPKDPNAENRIRVIWVKMRLMQAFPMNFNEALNPWWWMTNSLGVPPEGLPTYRRYLTNLRVSASTGADYESSACLLMALTQAVGGSGVKAEDLAGGQSVASFTLPSGQTIPAFVDAWGKPLTFARWPSACAPLMNPSTPDGSYLGLKDPGDPMGYLANDFGGPPIPPLMNPAWLPWLSTYGPTYTTYLHPLPAIGAYSYYLIPMIVSNGPDKKLGLDPISLATLSHDADDDIYSTTAP